MTRVSKSTRLAEKQTARKSTSRGRADDDQVRRLQLARTKRMAVNHRKRPQPKKLITVVEDASSDGSESDDEETQLRDVSDLKFNLLGQLVQATLDEKELRSKIDQRALDRINQMGAQGGGGADDADIEEITGDIPGNTGGDMQSGSESDGAISRRKLVDDDLEDPTYEPSIASSSADNSSDVESVGDADAGPSFRATLFGKVYHERKKFLAKLNAFTAEHEQDDGSYRCNRFVCVEGDHACRGIEVFATKQRFERHIGPLYAGIHFFCCALVRGKCNTHVGRYDSLRNHILLQHPKSNQAMEIRAQSKKGKKADDGDHSYANKRVQTETRDHED